MLSSSTSKWIVRRTGIFIQIPVASIVLEAAMEDPQILGIAFQGPQELTYEHMSQNPWLECKWSMCRSRYLS